MNISSLVFFDDGDEILFIGDLTGTSYNLSQDEWERILERCYYNFTVSVFSNQNDAPRTQWYFSAGVTFDIPD